FGCPISGQSRTLHKVSRVIEADMTGIGSAPCPSMAAENIRSPSSGGQEHEHHSSQSACRVNPIHRPQATTAIQRRSDRSPANRARRGGDGSFSHWGKSFALMPWKIIMFSPAAQIRKTLATK